MSHAYLEALRLKLADEMLNDAHRSMSTACAAKGDGQIRLALVEIVGEREMEKLLQPLQIRADPRIIQEKLRYRWILPR